MCFRTTSHYFNSLQSLVKDKMVCYIRKGAAWTAHGRKHSKTFRNPPFGFSILRLKAIWRGMAPALGRYVGRRNGSCLPFPCWLCPWNWKIKRLLKTVILEHLFFWNAFDFPKRIISRELGDFNSDTQPVLGIGWRAHVWRVVIFGGLGSLCFSAYSFFELCFSARFKNLPGVFP